MSFSRHGSRTGSRPGLLGILVLAITTAPSTSLAQSRASEVAFVRKADRHWQLWIMSADGSNPRQLTTSPVDKHSPAWCPGNRVLRVQTIYGDSVLYEIATGREEVELPSFRVGPVGVDGKTVPAELLDFRASKRRRKGPAALRCAEAGGDAEVVELRVPTGMPSGGAVVLQRSRASVGRLGVDVKIVDLSDREGMSTLSSGREARLGRILGGDRLVYAVDEGGATEIRSVHVDGGPPEMISTISGNARNLTWSPDATALLFDSDHAGVRQIYRMSADGRNLEALTRGSAPARDPAWSFAAR